MSPQVLLKQDFAKVKNILTAGLDYESKDGDIMNDSVFFGKSYAYASYSRSFRYPVLDELFSFFTSTFNPSLIPQTTDNYEVGVRHYFTDDIYMHVNVFRMITDNEIFYNPSAYENENLDGKTAEMG